MSEEQRYSKEGRAGWDPDKGQGNKGENRQKSWTANLRSILAEANNIDSDVKSIVNTIMDHENIPRKKPKFVNFVKNIMRNRANVHAIDKTWDLFSQALKPPVDTQIKTESKAHSVETMNEKDTTEEVNGNNDMEVDVQNDKKSKKEKKKDKLKAFDENVTDKIDNKKKSKKKKKKDQPSRIDDENLSEETSEKENTNISKKKQKKKQKEQSDINNDENQNRKRKRDDDMEVDEEISSPKKSKFDWDEVISSLLEKKEGQEMKLNKLKKKCVGEYFAQHEGTHKTLEEIGAKFDKKLKKRKFRVLKDKVKLILDDTEKEDESVATEIETKQPSKVEAPKSNLSYNMWEASNLGSASQTEKFRRLMGIKTAPPPQAVQGKFGGSQRDDKKIFRDLEQGFEKARQAHFGGRCFDQ